MIKQILLNIIHNAQKSTEEGSITINVQYKSSRDLIKINIVDTGQGISQDQVSKLNKQISEL